MDYEISIADDATYILCRVTGSFSAADALQFTADLDALGRAQKIKRYLVDVRSATNVSTVTENYQFAYSEMSSLNLQGSVRSAVLKSAGDSSHDFVEIVTQNAGYVVRLFEKMELATAWLNGDGGDESPTERSRSR